MHNQAESLSRQGVKVCMLSSVHPSDDIRIFHKEAVSLAEAGYDVSCIAKHEGGESVKGVRMIPLIKPANRLERMFKTARELWKKAVQEDADIYHFHDPELIPVGLMLKWKGKKVIYDVHEDVPRQILSKQWIARPLRAVTAWLVEKLEHYAARRFDAVVTATSFIEKRYAVYAGRIITVNNYPLLHEFDTLLPRKPEPDAVCYIGGVSRERGILEMVDAIGRTEARLWIAGPVRSSRDREEAGKKKGWSQVQELGLLSRDEVVALLARSSAGLVVEHPIINYLDSLPIKLFEYMAAGVPVVASDFPVWREIVAGAECGLCVDPLDDGKIAEAIVWLLEHPEDAATMGKNGQQAILSKYNWDTQCSKLLSLYEVLSKGAASKQSQVQGVTLVK